MAYSYEEMTDGAKWFFIGLLSEDKDWSKRGNPPTMSVIINGKEVEDLNPWLDRLYSEFKRQIAVNAAMEVKEKYDELDSSMTDMAEAFKGCLIKVLCEKFDVSYDYWEQDFLG